MRARVSSETPPRPLSTLETVEMETSASAATSARVARVAGSPDVISADMRPAYFSGARTTSRSNGLRTVENAVRIIDRLDLPKAFIVGAVVGSLPVRQLEVWEVGIDPSGSLLMHAAPRAFCPGTSGASRGVRSISCGRGHVLNQELFLTVHKSSRLRRDIVVPTAHWREAQFARFPGLPIFGQVAQQGSSGARRQRPSEEFRLAEDGPGVASVAQDRIHLCHRSFE